MKMQRMKKFVAYVLVFVLVAGIAIGFNPINVAASGDNFAVRNPYAAVDWDNWGQYKAATHVHTTNSDGAHTVAQTLERLYELGFNVVAITDHDVLTECWTIPPTPS